MQIKKLFQFFFFMVLPSMLWGENYSLSFDGVDDYVDVGTNVDAINNFTVEFWFSAVNTHQIDGEYNTNGNGNLGTSGQHYAFGGTHGDRYGNANTHAGVGISIGTNGVSVYEHGSNYMPSLLVWEGELSGMNHLMVTYEDRQPRLYINGVFQKAGLIGNREYVHVGLHGADGLGAFEGILDEVRVWDYTKADAEIASTWNAQTNGNESGLVAYWDFNEGSGSTAIDLSGNGNDGNILNGATWIENEGGSSSTSYCDANVPDGWADNSNDNDDFCTSNQYQDWYVDSDGDGQGSDTISSDDLCTDTTSLTGSVLNSNDEDDNCASNVHDSCGVCDGDNSSCSDACGVPNGDNSTCTGCAD
ncbi:uncharacterized protein METZ01_LOCUS248018, partial [marine metagenome]